MTDTSHQTIDSVELRDLMEFKGEDKYVLLDVREDEEYGLRHLPGALHFPLTELFAAPAEVPLKEHTIIYCSSGRRSMLAALTLAPLLPNGHRLYVLEHGLMGWDGKRIVDLPNLRAFDTADSLRDLLIQGIDLEKGAHRLYETFAGFFAGTAESETLKKLMGVEINHAKSLYTLASNLDGPALPPFEVLFDQLEGELLESGDSYEDAVALARAASDHGPTALFEICLEMELKAYDLYRSLANEFAGEEGEELLLGLAQQEKTHARLLLTGLLG